MKIIASAHHGAGAAHNLGLLHARGRFIQFLDADDLLQPIKIAEDISFLRTHPADVVLSSICVESGVGNRIVKKINEYKLPAPDLLALLLSTYISVMPLFNQSFLKNHSGFNPQFNFGEDLELLYRLCCHRGRFAARSGIGYVYRHINSSCLTQRRFTADDFSRNLLLYEHLQSLAKSAGMLTCEVKKGLGTRLFKVARRAYRTGFSEFGEQFYQRTKSLYRKEPVNRESIAYQLAFYMLGPERAEQLAELCTQ